MKIILTSSPPCRLLQGTWNPPVNTGTYVTATDGQWQVTVELEGSLVDAARRAKAHLSAAVASGNPPSFEGVIRWRDL